MTSLDDLETLTVGFEMTLHPKFDTALTFDHEITLDFDRMITFNIYLT